MPAARPASSTSGGEGSSGTASAMVLVGAAAVSSSLLSSVALVQSCSRSYLGWGRALWRREGSTLMDAGAQHRVARERLACCHWRSRSAAAVITSSSATICANCEGPLVILCWLPRGAFFRPGEATFRCWACPSGTLRQQGTELGYALDCRRAFST